MPAPNSMPSPCVPKSHSEGVASRQAANYVARVLRGEQRTASSLLLQILRRRKVARIDRLCQKFLFVVGPELAHVGIGLDHRVDEFTVLPFTFANEHGADDVAEMVEMEGAARSVGQRDAVQRLRERLAVVGLAAEFFQGCL